MPRERLPMRKIRDVLRLHADKLSKRRIAVSVNLGRTAVRDYIKRATRVGLSWPLPEGLCDQALERLLFPPPIQGRKRAAVPDRRSPPDWPALHRELKRPGVTLSLLWEEYRAVHPEGYGYSRFCDLYRAWRGKLKPTMRQAHLAGEKMFVDYAGTTAEVIDPRTGEIHEAQVFVATLGASSYSYAEATWTQSLPDWIGAHSRAFAYFGGVPAQVVPDNLKSGVVRACLYDPEINRTYADMAAHYGTAILPARPRKPRDKAKVEVAVQVVERWILARLRNHRFFSLAELNQAMAELLEDLNGRVTRHLGASRRQLFEELDRPALKSLPAEPYEYAEWKQRRAGLDYHVEVAKHYYSVPHALAKLKLCGVRQGLVRHPAAVEGTATGGRRNGYSIANNDRAEPTGSPERGHRTGGGEPVGGLSRRFSAQRKLEAVRRLMRGEPLELVARELNVTAARLSAWQDRALLGAGSALKDRERDRRGVRAVSTTERSPPRPWT